MVYSKGKHFVRCMSRSVCSELIRPCLILFTLYRGSENENNTEIPRLIRLFYSLLARWS